MILLIDNYDSFTWNLVHLFAKADIGVEVRVVRHDAITADEAESLAPGGIVLSPGPGTPDDAGVCPEIIERFIGRTPILGVCLGHQCLGAVSGMAVTRAPAPIHGKTASVRHDGRGVFEALPDPLTVARYHSLVVPADAVANGWEVSAWLDDADAPGGRIVMGLRRVASPGEASAEGVQFHPESFLTDAGVRLAVNFLRMAAQPA